MTDNDQERAAPPPPRRRKSPATKHVPPPPRRARPQTVAGAGNGAEDAPPAEPNLSDVLAAVNTVGGKVERLEQRVERVETGGMKTIDQVQESKAINREADPEELTPFVANIREQTTETPTDYKRKATNYNYPLKLYAKPDGSIVSLQGDPGNRAYYRDKGYAELDVEQTRRWYGGERQQVVLLQQEKAQLIETLREQLDRDKDLRASISSQTEKAWDHMSVAELSAFLDEVMNMPDRHGKPRRKLRPPQRLIDAENRKAQAENDRLMAGVETSADTSKEAFEAKLDQARRSGRNIA